MDRDLKIIYEDDVMVVCDKRAGLAVQSARVGTRDLESLVRAYLVKKNKRRNNYMAVVHRLDQPVEGIMVFAKTKEAAAHLSRQIKEHRADKYYLTVVEGVFEKKAGLLVDYLKKDSQTNSSRVVDKSDKAGKESRLEYRIIETKGERQLLEIHLLTGRHHQIRVQLCHAGHPIVGDTKYNPAYQNTRERIFPALCAYKLVLTHPVTGKRLELKKKPTGNAFEEFEGCVYEKYTQ